KSPRFPVVCIGSDFWSGLHDFMEKTLLRQYKTIDAEDLLLFEVTDDVHAAADFIQKHAHKVVGKRVPHLRRTNGEFNGHHGPPTRLHAAKKRTRANGT
ncbi:MAG: hypothetical protein GX592_07165, partial [Clostridiales bacterium]|nr:hypothetical protein [Clostridiales bacterium]